MFKEINFTGLVEAITSIHYELANQTGVAIDMGLTIRNWSIGCYLATYQAEEAELLTELANRLTHLSSCSQEQLNRYIRFYKVYPQLIESLPARLKGRLLKKAPSPTVGVDSTLFNRLSYNHLELLVELSDEKARVFYESETLKGGWSVNELNRRINELHYESSVDSSGTESEEHLEKRLKAFYYNPVKLVLW